MKPLGLIIIYIASISAHITTYNRGIHIGEKTHHQDHDIIPQVFSNIKIASSNIKIAGV